MERSTEFETEYDNRSHFEQESYKERNYRSHFEQESYKERNYISFKLPAAMSRSFEKSPEKDDLLIRI